MSGDYTRETHQPRKRYSGVLMQQGRVQLDADWNEGVEISARRWELQAIDTFSGSAVPETTPDAFELTALAGPPPDLAIGVGRFYVDGLLAEILDDEAFTYLNQPFLPEPEPFSAIAGPNAIAYVDVWKREITYVEDPEILDVALGGPDTATRVQIVWQVKLLGTGDDPAECGADLNALLPPSGGRLSSRVIAPPAADTPCIIAPNGGYRGPGEPPLPRRDPHPRRRRDRPLQSLARQRLDRLDGRRDRRQRHPDHPDRRPDRPRRGAPLPSERLGRGDRRPPRADGPARRDGPRGRPAGRGEPDDPPGPRPAAGRRRRLRHRPGRACRPPHPGQALGPVQRRRRERPARDHRRLAADRGGHRGPVDARRNRHVPRRRLLGLRGAHGRRHRPGASDRTPARDRPPLLPDRHALRPRRRPPGHRRLPPEVAAALRELLHRDGWRRRPQHRASTRASPRPSPPSRRCRRTRSTSACCPAITWSRRP